MTKRVEFRKKDLNKISHELWRDLWLMVKHGVHDDAMLEDGAVVGYVINVTYSLDEYSAELDGVARIELHLPHTGNKDDIYVVYVYGETHTYDVYLHGFKMNNNGNMTSHFDVYQGGLSWCMLSSGERRRETSTMDHRCSGAISAMIQDDDCSFRREWRDKFMYNIVRNQYPRFMHVQLTVRLPM